MTKRPIRSRRTKSSQKPRAAKVPKRGHTPPPEAAGFGLDPEYEYRVRSVKGRAVIQRSKPPGTVLGVAMERSEADWAYFAEVNNVDRHNHLQAHRIITAIEHSFKNPLDQDERSVFEAMKRKIPEQAAEIGRLQGELLNAKHGTLSTEIPYTPLTPDNANQSIGINAVAESFPPVRGIIYTNPTGPWPAIHIQRAVAILTRTLDRQSLAKCPEDMQVSVTHTDAVILRDTAKYVLETSDRQSASEGFVPKAQYDALRRKLDEANNEAATAVSDCQAISGHHNEVFKILDPDKKHPTSTITELARHVMIGITEVIALADSLGWNGVDNSKILHVFLGGCIETLRARLLDTYRALRPLADLTGDHDLTFDIVDWAKSIVKERDELKRTNADLIALKAHDDSRSDLNYGDKLKRAEGVLRDITNILTKSWGVPKTPAEIVELVREHDARHLRAVRTLLHLGYVDHGGEQWAPPLGKVPDFNLLDEQTKRISDLTDALGRENDASVRILKRAEAAEGQVKDLANECATLRANLGDYDTARRILTSIRDVIMAGDTLLPLLQVPYIDRITTLKKYATDNWAREQEAAAHRVVLNELAAQFIDAPAFERLPDRLKNLQNANVDLSNKYSQVSAQYNDANTRLDWQASVLNAILYEVHKEYGLTMPGPVDRTTFETLPKRIEELLRGPKKGKKRPVKKPKLGNRSGPVANRKRAP